MTMCGQGTRLWCIGLTIYPSFKPCIMNLFNWMKHLIPYDLFSLMHGRYHLMYAYLCVPVVEHLQTCQEGSVSESAGTRQQSLNLKAENPEPQLHMNTYIGWLRMTFEPFQKFSFSDMFSGSYYHGYIRSQCPQGSVHAYFRDCGKYYYRH